MVAREILRIRESCREFERLRSAEGNRFGRTVPRVSSWSPAQHAEHVLLATEGSLKGVLVLNRAADQASPVARGGPNWRGYWVLFLGRIPRGAQAPARVQPSAEPEPARLDKLFANVNSLLDRIQDLPAAEIAKLRGRIDHPVLGGLSARQWIRFARIHLDHHLRLVRKILTKETP